MRLAEQLTEKRAEVQIETEANDELFREYEYPVF